MRAAKTAAWLWLVLALSMVPAPSRAADTLTPLFGGDGGIAYALRCPAGAVLTGLGGRSGAWLDQVAPLCSTGRPAGTAAGGSGGQPAAAPCPAGSRVVAVTVDALRGGPHVVDRVDLRCAPLGARTPVTATPVFNPAAGPRGRDDGLKAMLDCGPQEPVGIHGRAGVAVDALGLICGDRAGGVTPATATAGAAPALPAAAAGGGCLAGFAPREAVPGDTICVAPSTRAEALRDNATAKYRSATGVVGGACVAGFVWREATPSDLVCVFPETRARAKADNAAAAARRGK